MKKILSIFALAIVFASCGSNDANKATSDTTATKVEATPATGDTIPATKVDTVATEVKK